MPSRPDAADVFGKAILAHPDVIRQMWRQQPAIHAIAPAMTATLHSGGKILWCGNGGGAGDAHHLAAELVGRFRQNRRRLASIALTTDSSILTTVANDFGFETARIHEVHTRAGHMLCDWIEIDCTRYAESSKAEVAK